MRVCVHNTFALYPMYGFCSVAPPPKCRQKHVHSQILRLERADAEVAYRALVGLGNVVS
jgi:hypothetical protein